MYYYWMLKRMLKEKLQRKRGLQMTMASILGKTLPGHQQVTKMLEVTMMRMTQKKQQSQVWWRVMQQYETAHAQCDISEKKK